MDRTSRDLEQAVRKTPREERDRYEEEWRGDAAAAAGEGAEPAEVARGARIMSRRRRMRGVEGALLGRRGLLRAFIGWLLVAVVVAAAWLVGGVFLLAAVVLAVAGVVVSFHAGVPSRWARTVMVISVVVGLVSLVFAFWAFGAGLDARDAGATEPVAIQWIGVALLVALVSVVGFVAALVTALSGEARIARGQR